jgi:TRAP-type C4-dicarboxylate transport system permease small subunit
MVSEVSSKQMTRFDKIVTRISRYLTVAGAVILSAMMVIKIIDIVGRYVFAHPLKGADELTGILLIAVATWGMGYCQIIKRNVRIDMIFARVNPTAQTALNIITNLVFIKIGTLITWQMWGRMIEYLNDPHGVTEILGLPFWPFMLLAVIGFGWATFIFIIEIIEMIKDKIKR